MHLVQLELPVVAAGKACFLARAPPLLCSCACNLPLITLMQAQCTDGSCVLLSSSCTLAPSVAARDVGGTAGEPDLWPSSLLLCRCAAELLTAGGMCTWPDGGTSRSNPAGRLHTPCRLPAA